MVSELTTQKFLFFFRSTLLLGWGPSVQVPPPCENCQRKLRTLSPQTNFGKNCLNYGFQKHHRKNGLHPPGSNSCLETAVRLPFLLSFSVQNWFLNVVKTSSHEKFFFFIEPWWRNGFHTCLLKTPPGIDTCGRRFSTQHVGKIHPLPGLIPGVPRSIVNALTTQPRGPKHMYIYYFRKNHLEVP